MRLIIDVCLAVMAFFSVLAAININEQYADMVAEMKAPTGLCNVSFGSSSATMDCNRISRLDDK